jgi:hypothetical protein
MVSTKSIYLDQMSVGLMVFDPKIWSHECLPQLLMIKVKPKKKNSNQKCYQRNPQKWHQQKEDVNISIHKRKIQTKMAN